MQRAGILLIALFTVLFLGIFSPLVAFELNRPGHARVFTIHIQDVFYEDLHWNTPSNFIIYDDGVWYLFAQHIANMQRTGGFFDTGTLFEFYLRVDYYSDSNCSGTVVHSMKYHLENLLYKQEQFGASNSGVDRRFADVRDEVKCASSGVGMK